MIRNQHLVPEYYVEQSRDFQVLCRLYDYVFNATKFNIDTMQSLTNTQLVKDNILPLVGDKFGIYDKQSYSNRELLTALPNAIKYKGSLKSISMLLNAYLDSKNIFEYAIAYHSKDEQSAKEISEVLRRDIQPYTIVIVLSSRPSLTELHVLNEYLKMVVPCGMFIEYIFGVTRQVLDKFQYSDYVFVFYTHNLQPFHIADKNTNYHTNYSIIDDTDRTQIFKKVITSKIDVNSIGSATVASYKDIISSTNGENNNTIERTNNA